MSYLEAPDPSCDEETRCAPVELVVVPRSRDLGGFEVRRVLPAAERRMVGPFIFFDQMGPASFDVGEGIDVRPHPHIGLSTVTYLFDGSVMHRDSLGNEMEILPGDVNWMQAGRGIVHSERSARHVREEGGALYGIQAWVALPKAQEEAEPGFWHHPVGALPEIVEDGTALRIIAGSLRGTTSPVETSSDTLYAELRMEEGSRFTVPAEVEERGLYIVEGSLIVDEVRYEAPQLLVLRPGSEVAVTASGPSRVMLLGGEPMDGPRHIWWNFVSSSKERIEQAKDDWHSRRFPEVPGDDERIPLPD